MFGKSAEQYLKEAGRYREEEAASRDIIAQHRSLAVKPSLFGSSSSTQGLFGHSKFTETGDPLKDFAIAYTLAGEDPELRKEAYDRAFGRLTHWPGRSVGAVQAKKWLDNVIRKLEDED